MNSRHFLLLICLLGFSSLAFADIDITYAEVDANGIVVSSDANSTTGARVLQGKNYACTFILYSKETLAADGGLAAFLNVFGPPNEGSVDNLATLGTTPSYFHNLYRIVYQGSNCDCTVTVFQGTQESGKSKNYYTSTYVDSSSETKIDIDSCWAGKAESISVSCRD